VVWAIPFGIIGGRLYHVVSSPDAYFGPGFDGTGDLSLIPQIQRGGLGIWGAVVLGVVGAWIGCRRSGVKLTAFLDAAAPGLLLAQAVGRWGNYFNQELFGGPTTLPWGLQIDADNPNFPAGTPADTLFHPTFLYESLWNLAGVVILLALDRKFNFRRSRLFWLYAMYYTLGRVWIEAMRIDDAEQISLFGITTRLNVWTSIFVFLAALVAFILLGRKKRAGSDSVYLPGREPAKEAGPREGSPEDAVVSGDEVRDPDPVVSDSESRDNLPDNQSGSRRASVPTEGAAAAPAGTTPGQDATAAGNSGSTATGTAPEAGATK
jgi:prolipoprotein diacylglyceryl transferase